MVGSRAATAAVGLGVSLAASVALWWYFDTVAFFLFLPFVPLLFRRGADGRERDVRECPRCGFRSADDEFESCPRDGTRLERAESRQ